MKKLFIVAAVACVASLAACNGTKEAKDEGADLKAKIENCSDPDSLKIYVQQAQDYAQKLIADGKDKDAQAYLQEIIPAVTAKCPALVTSLTNEADSAACALKDKAAAKADSVKCAAKAAKDSVAAKAGEVVNSAKDAAKEAVGNAADKAAQKAGDAANAAADKVKGLVGGK